MIKQFVTHEACLACRGCCRFSSPESEWSPYLLAEEVEALAKNNFPPACISQNKTFLLMFDAQQDCFICPCLDPETNRCRIYQLRPLECQLYPFLLNRTPEGIFLAVDERCPFVELHAKTEGFSKYSAYLADLLSSQPFKILLQNNPRLIQAYTDVRNLQRLQL